MRGKMWVRRGVRGCERRWENVHHRRDEKESQKEIECVFKGCVGGDIETRVKRCERVCHLSSPLAPWTRQL